MRKTGMGFMLACWLFFPPAPHAAAKDLNAIPAGFANGTSEPQPLVISNEGEPSFSQTAGGEVDSVDLSLGFIVPEQSPIGLPTAYSLIVSNAGPARATEILLTNQVPIQLQNVSFVASQGAFVVTDQQLRWDVGTLEGNQAAVIEVRGTAAAAGDAIIAATVRPKEFDWNYFQNNVGSVLMKFGTTDVAVAISRNSPDVVAGEPFIVTVFATNAGPDPSAIRLSTVVESPVIVKDYRLSQGSVITFRQGGIPSDIDFGEVAALSEAMLELTLVPLQTGNLGVSTIVASSVIDLDAENDRAAMHLLVQEGQGILRFAESKIQVREDEGEAAIRILREQGSKGTVEVRLLAQDGTAFSGQHYAPPAEDLVFAPGEAVKTVTVPIQFTAEAHCNRDFHLQLAEVTGGAMLLGTTNLEVLIFDTAVDNFGLLQPVSVSTVGEQMGNGESGFSCISGDGTRIAFTSLAPDIVPLDQNGLSDVFLFEATTRSNQLVSLNMAGEAANGASLYPVMTTDGRYIAFLSFATDLVTNQVPANRPQIYLRDTLLGLTHLVSVAPGGQGADVGGQFAPGNEQIIVGLSDDGQVVAFLNDGADISNDYAQLFVRDFRTEQTTRITKTPDGGFPRNSYNIQACLSADGDKVAFISGAPSIVAGFPNVNGQSQIYVRVLSTGITHPASVGLSGGLGNASSFNPKFSHDGRHLVFQSEADNLVEGDDNPYSDIFALDLLTGEMTWVSEGVSGPNEIASISGDGQAIAFRGGFRPGEPGPNPSGNSSQLYLWDRLQGASTLISTGCSGRMGNRHSFNPEISRNGKYVFFQSYALDLVPGIFPDGMFQLFRYDVVQKTQVLLSRRRTLDGGGFSSSSLPLWVLQANISEDGESAVVGSPSDDLVFEDDNGYPDLFLWRSDGVRQPSPSLWVGKEDNQILVKWPAGATNAVLQGRTDTAGDWEELPTEGNEHRIEQLQKTGYYRLEIVK